MKFEPCIQCGLATRRGTYCLPCEQRIEARRATVKRATLFDGILDTMQTETELNGWQPTQGRML